MNAAPGEGTGADQEPAGRHKSAGHAAGLMASLDGPADGPRAVGTRPFSPRVLFLLVLAMGIFARVWEYDQLPPGLNQDEASIGVEAYDLLHFGVDRNGISYPVNFVSWGSGQNALYAYVLLPFIAVGGLSPFTVRLPMLISGILTLVLVYFVGKRTLNTAYALLAMFLLAICPWHIILSRWGLESNILPFTFLLGYAALLVSSPTNRWFIAACLFFALCLYAYGTAYAAIPVFMLVMVPTMLSFGRVNRKNLLIGLAVFALVALPVGLLVLVNSMHLGSIHLGPFTIPRYPTRPRYEAMSAVFARQPAASLVHNLWTLSSLLVNQNDGLIWNGVEPYGYFYVCTFPLAIIGCAQSLFRPEADRRMERRLLMAWLAASLMIGALQEVNLTRINLVLIPLMLCMAIPLEWLWRHLKAACLLAMLALLVGFCFFTRDYHGADYRQQADGVFFTNLLPALDLAQKAGNNPICVTDHLEMPYIFVLFSERLDPGRYLEDIRYRDPSAEFREVVSLDRYAFGVENCPDDPGAIYVLSDEQPPDNGLRFELNEFGSYHVYVPESAGQ